MLSKLNFQGKNYSKLFDESYCYSSNNVKLQDRHCGKASVYEVTLGWLKILQDAASNESEANKVLVTKLSFMVPHLEEIIEWAHECNGVSFVKDLILTGPKFFDAPERKAKIPLGEAGLALMGEMLVSRVNTLADRAVKRMSYYKNNDSHYFDSVEQLQNQTPGYFEWKGSSSETHLTFAQAVTNWWRSLDERVLQSIREVIEETKKISLEMREKKKQDRLERVKKNDQDELEKLKEKKKEEQPVVRMYAPIASSNQNAWKKPEEVEKKNEEPKKVEAKKPESKKSEQKRSEQKRSEQKKDTENKEQPKNLQSKKRKSKKHSRVVKKEESLVEPVQQEEQEQEQDQDQEDSQGGEWQTKQKKVYRGKHQNSEDLDQEEETQEQEVRQRPKRQFVLRGPKRVQQQNA